MSFDEWLDEIEVFSSRRERLFDDFENLSLSQMNTLMAWLKAAHEVGEAQNKLTSDQ